MPSLKRATGTLICYQEMKGAAKLASALGWAAERAEELELDWKVVEA